jgi:hypothetical protein
VAKMELPLFDAVGVGSWSEFRRLFRKTVLSSTGVLRAARGESSEPVYLNPQSVYADPYARNCDTAIA